MKLVPIIEGDRIAGGPTNLVCEPRSVLIARTTQSSAAVRPVAGAPSAQDAGSGAETESTHRFAQELGALRQAFQAHGKSNEQLRTSSLLHLHGLAHAFAVSAASVGLADTARLATALEGLLNELYVAPQKLNPSAMRTVAQAIDLLATLPENSAAQNETVPAPRILVVDDEPLSRQILCTALKRAGLTAIALEQPILALEILEESRFDLIFLDVEMPELNGFDRKKLRTTVANAKTPVVFVTMLTDFDTRARSNLSGGTDLIAKPVLLTELAVKALIHLFRSRARTATPIALKSN